MLTVAQEIERRKSDCAIGRAPTFDRKQIIQLKEKHLDEEKESNEHRIEGRMKQIQYGKNTVGYDNYLAVVPKEKRKKIPSHPRTPDPYEQISKRNFDGKIKAWRRALHLWDNSEVRPDSDVSTRPPPSKGMKRKIDETNNPITPNNTLKRQKQTNPTPRDPLPEEDEERKESITAPLGEVFDDEYHSDVLVDYEELEDDAIEEDEDVL